MALFIVDIPDLNGMTKKQAEEYVRESVRGWAGGCHSDHPFFSFLSKPGKMKVTTVTEDQIPQVERALLKRKKGFFPVGHEE